MKPAIIVVDMVKDNLKAGSHHPITQAAREILPPLQRLLEESRRSRIPVIFACDSFMEGDFIFKGKMKVHSLRGTAGSEVAEELGPEPTDLVVPKRRFSAFFKTDLDQTLRTLGVDTIAVTGMTTEVCVLMTAMDGLCNDFSVIILEDCCVSRSGEMHRACLSLYRDFALYPLLKIMSLEEFLKGLSSSQ
jgi:nicotinamidase/pyrazinamidase